MGEYESNRKEVRYYKFKDEKELLTDFLLHWSKNYPDVLTGWNSRFFDLPYLFNRIKRVLTADGGHGPDDDKWVGKRMSPFGLHDWREITAYNMPVVELIGIQQLDYLDLFRKFAYTYGTQESYSLNNIAHVVLDEKKLDYSEYKDLNELYTNDHQKFINYNIKDVELVDRLEDKLGLITLAMTIAYKGGVNYVDTFANVPVWDAIINKELRKRGIVEDSRRYVSKDGQIVGAYVKDPLVGMHNWICSFDLNSLYPHLIMQYNMSPETIIPDEIKTTVDDLLNNGEYNIPKGYCMSARGNLFSTEKRGILPELVERFYDDRVVAKNEMLKTQQDLESFEGDKFERYKFEKKIATLGNQQMAIKILMNSLYGAMSNEYFRYFDTRIAESITLSGQHTIRLVEKTLNNYLNNILSTVNVDYIIAVDTDSVYVNFGPLIDHVYPDGVSLDKGSTFLDKVASQKIKPILEKAFAELKEYMKAPYQKMVMKREVVANKGIWTGKKHYILNVINSEGIQFKEPKLKMMGIEAVRSSTPQWCRTHIKDTLTEMMAKNEVEVQEYIKELRKEFNQLPVEDIAFPRGVRGLDKYKDNTGGKLYGKSTPIHVRGALIHNHYLKEYKVVNKYGELFNGDKLKFCYLKLPNMVKENVIAFKNVLPDEFKVRDYVDYDKMFDKGYLDAIRTIMTAIGWSPEQRQRTLEDFWA
jgi:DNA polymerase elongation subunit (family B)